MQLPIEPPLVPVNCPERAGSLARQRQLFGPGDRYGIAPVNTRFDAVEWFVWDWLTEDAVTGNAAVIRQVPTFDEALAGF